MGTGLIRTEKALLTPETEVAGLVAQGLTNPEISQWLFISERTADGHLEVATGKVIGQTAARHRNEEFRRFPNLI